ncbi:MAG: cation transporter [Candidatus Riflebacteria bacterium]|nr:cation transporter [Candidatus Riflebacteria bacterium]
MIPSRFGVDKKKPQKVLDCKNCAMRAQYLSLFLNIFLAFFKVVAGTITGSIGLVADAIHSCADVLNSFVVMIAMNISKIPHDEKHAYGYGKIENFSGVFVGTLLFVGATVIVDAAFDQLITPEPVLPPHPIGLMVALISVVTNDFCYRIEICGAKKTNSPALEADALENRSDSLITIAVIIGMAGAQLGFKNADPIAALVVAFITVPMAWTLLSRNICELLDIGQDYEQIALINSIIRTNSEVMGISYTRTRYVGSSLLIDIEILVGKDVSIGKTEEISRSIKESLIAQISHIGDVTIVCRSEETEDPKLIQALNKMVEDRKSFQS